MTFFVKDSRDIDISEVFAVNDWHVFTWKISDVRLLPYEVDYVVQSPLFTFDNASWIIKMYLHGQTEYKTEGYIDIIIENLNSSYHKLNFNMYCENTEFNRKNMSFLFDHQWSCSRVHRFMPSLHALKLKDPFTLVFEFGMANCLIQSAESPNVDNQEHVDREKRNTEVGVIFKRYSAFKSFWWNIYELPSNTPADYYVPTPMFSFANAMWILKAYPYYTSCSDERNIRVVLERFDSEVSERNTTLNICLKDFRDNIAKGTYCFNSPRALADVAHFPFIVNSQLRVEMKVKNYDFKPTIDGVKKIEASEAYKGDQSEIVESDESESFTFNQAGATETKESGKIKEIQTAEANKSEQSEVTESDVSETSTSNQSGSDEIEESDEIQEIRTAEANKGDQSEVASDEFESSASNQTGGVEIEESDEIKEIRTLEANNGDELEIAPDEFESSASNQTGGVEIEESVSFINLPEDYGFMTDINHLLKEARGVDVTFVLETPNGETKIVAHQLILSVMSSYFADKFYDKQTDKGYQIITLKGINPNAFEELIRYCYGYKPNLETTEEVCAVCKSASQFKVISLLNSCAKFLRSTKIETGNVFSVLEITEEIEDESLKNMCYKILQENTREVLASYELHDVTPAMVQIILDLPKLSLNSEHELIRWMFDWAKAKSEEKNTRDFLDIFLPELNFMSLTGEEFAMLCKDNPDFFCLEEMASISLNIAIPGTRNMPEWHERGLKFRVYTE